MQHPLGVITVASAGTPVTASATSVRAQSVLFQALANAAHTNTGNIFILCRDDSGTPVRVATLAIPTANSIPSFSVTIYMTMQSMDVSDYYVDAAVSGDGVDVSYARP